MKSATQSDAVLRAGGRLSSRASSDYSWSSVPQTRQLRRGKKIRNNQETVPVLESCLKCRQEQDAFLFLGGDIKVGGVLKRLPAHSDSFPTNLKRIIRLSGVSFKDMSISSNFKSHPKRKFETKEGTNKARTVDGRHASPSRTFNLQVGLSLSIKRCPALRDSHTCCVSYYYPPSALLRLLLSLRQSPCDSCLAPVTTWKTGTKFLKHKLTSSYSGSQQQQEGRSYSSLMDSAAHEVLHTASSLFLGFGKKTKKHVRFFCIVC